MQIAISDIKSRESYRPHLGSGMFSVLLAVYLLAATNHTFWSKANLYLAADPFAFAALPVAVGFLFVAAITLLSSRYLAKPFSILLIIAAGIGSWFTDRFGVVIDADMVRNAFETTPAEAQHLITPDFLLHIGIYILLPVALILWARISHRPFLRKLLWNAAMVFACLAIFAAIALAGSKPYITAIRQHRDLLQSLNPVTPLVGTVKYFLQAGAERGIVVKPLGLDAKIMPPAGNVRKPRVTIIVAGETARAANFSLGGYARDTNPELARQDIFYFPDTTSCGTATATSIPCMFSQFTRSTYSHTKAMENETLVDVLAHAGVDVAWWDNNTGSKGVANRITYVNLAPSKDPRFCKMGECQDGIFFDKLDAWLDHVTKDSVLVIHQLGSHGPTYYLRYPTEFRRFTPDCQTAEIANCKDAEIVNAYDNTILYTDHVLSTFIDKLKARSDRLAGGMIYMSDHGESLGENGLYLHGTPYMFAPDTQTHVPFLVWLDAGFTTSMGLDRACLKDTLTEPRSHDNLFHSVLGMMNIATKAYDPALDVFAGCKTHGAS